MRVDFVENFPASADILIVPVAKDRLDPSGLGIAAAGLVADAAAIARFKGGTGEIFEIFVEEQGRAVRVLLAGIGDSAAPECERAGAAAVAKVLTSGATQAALSARGLTGEQAADFATGFALRSWRHDVYRTKLAETAKRSVNTLSIFGAPAVAAKQWERHRAVVDGVVLTRELVTEPANVIYPESFVERCLPLANLGVELTILDEEEMRALGMGALLGVSQGSARPPRILAMRWDGTGGKQERPLVLIGKGVTFDTGGISLKPAAGMEDMKWDMGGAGAVAGTMKALAARKAKAHVVGICGLVENMPDGKAQRPGDVVTSMSGQTIEVINTDAEGRLVLCDVLHWAQAQFDPEFMIDLATLTGAMIVSLGHEYAGLFANDDALATALTDAGAKSGDKLWRFPLGKAYDKMIDSPIADIKNAGPRYGGSITAAQFIQRFVREGVKWAHLDIAGTVWADKPGATWDKGATGFGVRLLDRFVADSFER